MTCQPPNKRQTCLKLPANCAQSEQQCNLSDQNVQAPGRKEATWAANSQNPTRKDRKSRESDRLALAAMSLRIASESSAKLKSVAGRHSQVYEIFRSVSLLGTELQYRSERGIDMGTYDC